jgi:hypothetical protein
MEEHAQQVTEIIKQLPQPFQNRFNSLGGYVRSVIEELEKNTKPKNRLGKEDVSIIQLAVFIYYMNWFLQEGTRAAQASILTLESFGLVGFSVGSTVFTRDNENTLLGKNLAEGLMKSLGNSPLATYIKQAKNMPSLIRNLRDEMKYG